MCQISLKNYLATKKNAINNAPAGSPARQLFNIRSVNFATLLEKQLY